MNTDTVTVVVRCKPFTSREAAATGEEGVCCVSMQGTSTIITTPGTENTSMPLTRTFNFDQSLWSHDTEDTNFISQQQVFNKIGKDIVTSGMGGYNTTIFAYGQTGSGKSYTMMGNPKSEQERGLIPRISSSLFEQIQQAQHPKEIYPWVRQIDPTTNHEYYFNQTTEQSVWVKPDEYDQQQEKSTNTTSSDPDKEVHYKVQCSYLEIYNEQVRDLLAGTDSNGNGDPSITPEHKAFGIGKKKIDSNFLKVRENPKTGPYVEGLKSVGVESFADIDDLIRIGSASRVVASTQMNSESSRSHAIFKIRFTRTTVDHTTGTATDRSADINLVDLAGSERVKKSGATGSRLREAAAINKSLSTLGQCINKLSEGGGISKNNKTEKEKGRGNRGRDRRSNKTKKDPNNFVPYRNSVLTWLLKESFGGNARTIMLATVRPSASYFDETMSTLRYAERAKRIVNCAIINEDPNLVVIRQLREEVSRLRRELEASKQAKQAITLAPAPIAAPQVIMIEAPPAPIPEPAPPVIVIE